MKLLLIFLLPLSIYASKILSYNIYDRTDRVDVMITFDTPYDGEIRQSKSTHNIIIKLEDADIESSKLKKLSSKYITSLSITPMLGYTKIVASIPESVSLKASKTSDGYGLRLRFSNGMTYKKKTNHTKNEQANPFSSLPTKKTTEVSTSYYIVVSLLFIAIIVLFFVKKKLVSTNKNNSQWLFKQNATPPKQQDTKTTTTEKTENVSIRFQKSLNDENSVVMLDFGEQSYLVLMGRNNILLDKFTDNKPTTQSDFETILQSRHQELESFLNGNENSTAIGNNKPLLDAYTDKASSIPHEL